MNLNTVTRKILLLARSLHQKSLSRTVAKAQGDTFAKCKASRMAEAAMRAAEHAENEAIRREAAVRSAVATERRELGLN